MSLPSHRRLNRLDIELDALVAREVDALALSESRGAAGETAQDAAGPGPSPPSNHIENGGDPARASRPPVAAGNGAPREPAGTIGIERGGMRGELDDVALSAEEQTFVDEAVAFLEQCPNADILIDEICARTVLGGDRDAGSDPDARSPMVGEGFDEAPGAEQSSDDSAAEVRDRCGANPPPATVAQRPPDGDPDRASGKDPGQSPALDPTSLRPRKKKSATGTHGHDGSAR